MGIQRIKHKAGVVLAATALLTSVPAFAAATTAQAAATATCWTSAKPNNSDYVMTFNGTYNLKVGIGTVCANVSGGPWGSGTVFYVWCTGYNPDSNTSWFYGRIAGTQSKGYISAVNVSFDRGSVLKSCA
jgi:hypothetical protein